MGDVGLGHQRHPRRHRVEHVTKELDDLVRLGQVDRLGARLGPEVGDRVETDDVRSPSDVEEQRLEDRQQHPRVAEVEVDLVGRECRPDVLGPVDGLVAGQDVRRPWPEDLAALLGREVVGRVVGDEEVVVDGVAAQEPAEHLRARGGVVEDRVEHEVVVEGQLAHLLPGADLGVDRLEVDHREAPVRGVGEERQHVDGVDRVVVRLDEPVQRLDAAAVATAYRIGVGDEDEIALSEPLIRVQRCLLLDELRRLVCVVDLEDALELGHPLLRDLAPVEECQPFTHVLANGLVDLEERSREIRVALVCDAVGHPRVSTGRFRRYGGHREASTGRCRGAARRAPVST